MEKQKDLAAIDGVHVTPLKVIPTPNGAVYHMLKESDPQFSHFGEIYFSRVFENVIKGWHTHAVQVNHYAVPVGHIKLVIYDDRPDSKTCGTIMESVIGEEHYQLVTIPSKVWYAFQGLTAPFALVANCATLQHQENETRSLPIESPQIPYHWERLDAGK